MFLEAAGKFLVDGQPTIRDVCATCNNGPLSALDAYGARMFDRYFSHQAQPRDEIIFRYDYAFLIRWLSKLSYNLARASKTKSDIEVLGRLAPFLLGTAPMPSRMALFLAVFTAERIPDRTRPQVPEPFRSTGWLPPLEIRIARCEDPRFFEKFECVRMIAFQAYYFVLAIGSVNSPRRDWKANLQLIPTLLGGSVRLRPHETCVKLTPSRESWVALKEASVLKNIDIYDERYGPRTE